MNKKRFRKVMGFIKDNTCEKGDVEGLMDLTEIEDMLNELVEDIDNGKNDYRELFINYVYLQEKNIELQEEIVELRKKIKENKELQKKLDWLCEKYGYGSDGV